MSKRKYTRNQKKKLENKITRALIGDWKDILKEDKDEPVELLFSFLNNDAIEQKMSSETDYRIFKNAEKRAARFIRHRGFQLIVVPGTKYGAEKCGFDPQKHPNIFRIIEEYAKMNEKYGTGDFSHEPVRKEV